ncbi:translation initiation factor IF-2 isoform X1 [Macaca thibetana thibetana]|uniref:translation initiation factor IF-2 isoform X1 n=1 Tax=Macaca thibetana thibetana TaxID=257877 RepID=UPI0021BCB70A|nr:translation initiation factor IF-2 isoform X1 [Macaca thibetana thibetana]
MQQTQPTASWGLVPALFSYKHCSQRCAPPRLLQVPASPRATCPDSSRLFNSPWIPTALASPVTPAPAPAPASAKSANAPPARKAAAPAALWAVPSVPRAASAKGRRTSATAAPDAGTALLPDVNNATSTNLDFFMYNPDRLLHSFFYEII